VGREFVLRIPRWFTQGQSTGRMPQCEFVSVSSRHDWEFATNRLNPPTAERAEGEHVR
jgi:hypothetical protein